MAETYTLENPLFELKYDRKPDHWKKIVVAWLLFSVLMVVALLYLYAVVFAGIVGYETAVLVGIGLLALLIE